MLMAASGFGRTLRRLALALLILSPQTALCQLCEDFSDGEMSNNPSWSGDSNDFRINSNRQLQLYANQAGASQLSFPYALPDADTVEWTLWLRMGFTPTTSNYAIVALYADSSDLLSATQSLLLKVTNPDNSQKEITITQNSTPLFTFPYRPRLSSNPLRFRIRMVGRQYLTMDIDTIGETDSISYTPCGSVALAHTDIPDRCRFGISCQYTSSRAHLFYFDDIGINCDASSHNGGGKIAPGEVLVNEILFNPHPGGADYVELYNNSDHDIDLANIFLAKMNDTAVTTLFPIASSGTFAPATCIAVTTDATDIRQRYSIPYPDRLIQVSSMPSYADKQGTVAVTSSDGTLIDRFDYDETMHSRLLADKEGVALERRSTQRPTQEASNWYSAASTAAYGTPTGPNSQSREILFADGDFSATPSLFSPDGDGYNDLVDITYSLQQCSLAADITVFNRQGIAVRRLANATLLGCQGNIVWDGTDDNGQACSRGTYLIIVNAYNEKGARQSWRHTVNLVHR